MLFFILLIVQQCYTTNLPWRIYGGFDAIPEEYPYVVRIEEQVSYNYTNNRVILRNKHVCSATALSPIWSITVAHCLTDKYPIIIKGLPYTVKKMVIRYGHVESSPWKKDTFSEVIDAVMHPHYVPLGYPPNPTQSRNDIGLLKTLPLNIGKYVKLSAVDYKTVYGHEAIIGGFGVATKTDSYGKLVTHITLCLLKPLQLLKILLTKCDIGKVLVPAFCISSRCDEDTFVCPGDSGGPVLHASGLIALLTLSHSRCRGKNIREHIVATVTPVSPYIEWIYSKINA